MTGGPGSGSAQQFVLGAVLKQDALGRVERIDLVEQRFDGSTSSAPSCIRRVACGGGWPGSGWLARRLAARERRALGALRGLAGVPQALELAEVCAVPGPDGRVPRRAELVLRSWIAGRPLHRAEALPADFFDHLDRLVAELHARGVCHNDLHKEQNVLVDEALRPALVDFQLASLHRPGTRAFAVRVREDLRHVEKHRRRYTRWGRGPQGLDAPQQGAGQGLRRAPLSRVWRRVGKPLYEFLTRRVLRTRDGEERRPSSGPWPRWTAPLGPPRA